MNDQEWHEWRKQGLGSSDAPVVMGVSPWKTRYELWEEKTGIKVNEDKGNWATERGKALEALARQEYERLAGHAAPPRNVESSIAPFIRASLDGFNAEKNVVLEIKCPGQEDHAAAISGKVPEKYYPQIQHQLLVTGAIRADYYSYDGISGVIVPILPDAAYMATLTSMLINFWQLVQTKTPPEFSPADWRQVEEKTLQEKIKAWKFAKEELNRVEALEESLRKEIQKRLEKEHPRWTYDGINIQQIERAGKIDYKAIPELKGLDLEPYRKPSSKYWLFKLQ